MLFAKIFVFALSVATATALKSTKELPTELGVPPSDVDELLSTADVSSIDITKWSKAMKVDSEEAEDWPEPLKVLALEQIKETVQEAVDSEPETPSKRVAKRQETNLQKVQKQVDGIIAGYRSDHDADHRRRLAGCKSARCIVCGAGLSVAYVGSMVACDGAVVTEEAISAGALTPVAVVQVGACVTTASGVYGSGWSFCLGMS
ncbi:hypothetical protein EDB81DRAFT_840273 [Dactylonectria macrodidyma]|uniref:Uncharacterized protein n=1 Tax=Dactylonectria macrodidyma TaxID=307937 RepID=A0A9P9JFF6_9HYPO|nr:hypothetical protein EDB81DRAFT_840273 [Dactylonectria macrodidyma]